MPLKAPRNCLRVALLLTACSGSPSATPDAGPAPERGGIALLPDVRPFPVSDSAGRALDLAFLGGFNAPRPQLVDADGDGDLDLVVQEHTDQLILLANEGTGGGGVPRFSLRSRAWSGLRVGEWSRFVDLDGDGRFDVLGERPFGYLRAWRNNGSTAEPRFETPGDSIRDTEGKAVYSDRQNIPQVVDLDCDGRLDLFIGMLTGTIARYTLESPSAAQPVFRLLTQRFADLEIMTGQGSRHGANTMAFADVDRDGDLDLVWGDFFEAGLLWFVNAGTCRSPSFQRNPVRFPPGDPLVTSGYNAPAFGDVNGDARSDLIVGVLGGSYDPNRTSIQNLWLYQGEEGAAWSRRTGTLLPQIDLGSESAPALLDLDGDKDLDLLVGNKIEPTERGTARIYWFENRGTQVSPAFTLRGPLSISGQYQYAPASGDLDADGKPDLLVGSFGLKLSFWRNTSAPRQAPGFELVDSSVAVIARGSHASPALGDLDGDGDLDLVVGRASGYLTYFRNDGTPQAPRFTPVTEEWEGLRPGRRSAPHLADLDRDGDLDLLVGADEGMSLYWNEGARTGPRFMKDEAFKPQVPPLAHPVTSDLDGNGSFELIVGTAGGGLLYFGTAVHRR
jgi:hypothetical protein